MKKTDKRTSIKLRPIELWVPDVTTIADEIEKQCRKERMVTNDDDSQFIEETGVWDD